MTQAAEKVGLNDTMALINKARSENNEATPQNTMTTGNTGASESGVSGIDENHEMHFSPYPLRQLTEDRHLKRQQDRESNARSYPRRIPLTLTKAQGIYIQDSQEQVFIDALAAAGTLALGHSHPEIQEAITNTLQSHVPLQTLDLTTPIKEQFIDQLFALLPENMRNHSRVQFCSPSGADAVEAAIKLAKVATGRRTIMSFSGAYHGMTASTVNLMGNLGPKTAMNSGLTDAIFLPFPYAPRCPYGLGDDGAKVSLQQIETMLTDPESGVPKPAAIIVEAVQGEAGALPSDPLWLKGLRDIATEHGIVLILDEVQSGMGRTGKLFAFEHAGIEPDIIVLSKAIGGGLPLSLIVYKQELDVWQPGTHAGTFRGNQLAMACGQVVMRHLAQENLHLHAAKMGHLLHSQLKRIDNPIIGDVRGLGLMQGVEIINPMGACDMLGNKPQDGIRARQVQQAALKRGLIVEVGGRHGSTIRFLLPLIVSEQQIKLVVDIFADAIKHAAELSLS